MKKLEKFLKHLQKLALKKKKKTCFLISSTKKNYKKNYFISPFRESEKTVYLGAIVFDNNTARKIALCVNGKVDYVFVDIEKKTSNKTDKLVNVERCVLESINQSIIKKYKANDVTVNAVENFVQDYFRENLRGVGNKKILIAGVGNIGSKISLRLLESGAEVFMIRRNSIKLKSLVKTLNFIKPKTTIARCHAIKKNKLIFENYDVVIGCSNNAIKFDKIKKLNHKPLIIDVGKGVFSKNNIKDLNLKEISIFRLDIEFALNAVIDSNIRTEAFFKGEYTKKIGNNNLIKKGILGSKGDIVVDNIEKPKRIIGVCDKNGLLEDISLKKLKTLEKIINLEK